MNDDDESRPHGFDVEEATRLAAEVQELGFDAARMIVDRFVELFDGYRGGAGRSSSAGDRGRRGPVVPDPAVYFRIDDGARRRMQADAQRALESYFDVLRRVGELSFGYLDGGQSDREAADGDGLELPDVAPGGRTSTRVWLHNSTGSAAAGLRPWTSGLVSHDGSTLGAELVTFRPERVDRLEPGSSTEILVAVAAPTDAALGLYHGQILVEGLDTTAFPVRVRVVSQPTPEVIDVDDEPAASLARYGRMITDAAALHLDTLPVAEYLTEPLADYPARAGKVLRPSLCLATCEAFGGPVTAAVPSTLAIELMHNAFLVHDDIQDGSVLRRGEETLHRRYGMPLALNAGDGLALHAVAALRPNVELLGPRLADRVMAEFDFMSHQTVAGQALELGWRRDNRLDLVPDDYLDLIMKKTCWYTTVLPLRVGALIGSGGAADLEPMIDFGFHLGAAFQIRDDILNLIGDPDAYGKERLGDLREGKRTLMLIHLVAAATASDRRWVEGCLAVDAADRSDADLQRLFDLMQAYGSIAFASEFALGIARSAASSLDRAFAGLPDSPARRFVGRLVPYMVERPS